MIKIGYDHLVQETINSWTHIGGNWSHRWENTQLEFVVGSVKIARVAVTAVEDSHSMAMSYTNKCWHPNKNISIRPLWSCTYKWQGKSVLKGKKSVLKEKKSVWLKKIKRKPICIPEKNSVFWQISRKKICILPNSKGKKSVFTDKISMSEQVCTKTSKYTAKFETKNLCNEEKKNVYQRRLLTKNGVLKKKCSEFLVFKQYKNTK